MTIQRYHLTVATVGIQDYVHCERDDKGTWVSYADHAAEVERLERLERALVCIAHTFTEDSHGGTKSLPASEYQDIARAALNREISHE